MYNFLFNTQFSDITTCYKIFPRHIVPKALALKRDNFVFDIVELTHLLSKEGDVIEVPVQYIARSRKSGKKLDWREGIYCILMMMKIKLRYERHL